MRAADVVAVVGVKRGRIVAWQRWPCGSLNALPFHRAATVAGRAQRGGVSSGGGCGRVTCSEVGSLNADGMPCMMSVRADRGVMTCCRGGVLVVMCYRHGGRGGTYAVCRCHRVNVASACLQQVRTYDVPDIVLPPSRHCV